MKELDKTTKMFYNLKMIIEKDICLIKWMEEQPERSGLIQQLNCFHTQGAGIAKRIREKFPQVYSADIDHGKKGDGQRLGSFSVVEVLPNKFCYGLYGQYQFGSYARFTSYDAVTNGLSKILHHAEQNGLSKLGLPKNMGCRLGGGSWRIVKAIINDVFEESPVELYICNYDK